MNQIRKVALIFGVSGQDGAYLSSFLLKKGYEVHGTSRDAETASFHRLAQLKVLDKVTLHSVSLIDFRSTLQVIAKVVPDEIYNLSGQSSVGLSFFQPVETLESIATATLNILEALRFLRSDARFYNAGSSESFGDTDGDAANENTAFRPKSPYGVAKATAVWQVASYRESYSLFACSGILFNHESPLRASRFVTKKISQAAARIACGSDELLTLGDLAVRRDWGWAPEYVSAMWAMLQNREPSDYVIATGHQTSLQDFVETAFSSVDLDWREFTRYDEALRRPAEIQSGLGCPRKAADSLGWKAETHMPEIAARMVMAELAMLQGGGGDSADEIESA